MPTALPTDEPFLIGLSPKLGPECRLVTHGGCFPKPRAQVDLPVTKGVSAAGYKHHFPIHARSTPSNHTSTPSNHISDPDVTGPAFQPYSLHFLTNCQWSSNNEIENCTKPWDFVGYSLESDLLGYDDEGDGDGEDDDEKINSRKDDQPFRSFPLLLKRNGDNDTEPGEESDDEKYEKNARKLRDNRDAFSKVHLTGCVFVGLSFLCTAISFFILPALGQWVSVGNLALATLSTIFLFTTSIFTAVMANKIRSVMESDEGFSDIDAEPGKMFGALV